MIKNIFDIIMAVLFIIALIITWTTTKSDSKNKLLSTIEQLASAFVHEYEQVNISGAAKMSAVISAVEDVLNASGHKVDSNIDNLIRAFAEKEVNKINTSSNQITPSASKDSSTQKVPITQTSMVNVDHA